MKDFPVLEGPISFGKNGDALSLRHAAHGLMI
jgi:hypothetical protein